MKLEHQVCSLPLAKRLKKLGVKQDARYEWVKWGRPPWRPIISDLFPFRKPRFPAWSVAELGEMLPGNCLSAFRNDDKKAKAKWMAMLTKGLECGDMSLAHYELAQTEADARARLLIWLIEKGVVKP